MSKANKWIIGAAAVAAAGVLISIARKHKREKVLKEASEEGYETAHDVLYPKHNRSRHLKYGPVFTH